MIRTVYYLALMLLITLLGAGCMGQTPQSAYYTLSPMQNETTDLPSVVKPDAIAIGIGPVTFPDELNRPAIITESGRNQLTVNEFHRWGGSLEKNFIRVMAENIAILMKTDQVMARPWERYFQPDLRIALDIKQFGGRLGEYALINTTWRVFSGKKDDPAIVQRSVIREPVTDDSYDALVAAQSRALARLSTEIAAALKEILPAQYLYRSMAFRR